MKDISIAYSTNADHIKLRETSGPKNSDTTNLVQLSSQASEMLESFNLSLLNSPLAINKGTQNFTTLSELSSPYFEILEKITLFENKDKKENIKPNDMDLFVDALLRKREGCFSDDEKLIEYQLNFTKQLHRVKYYWRRTSLNYPFTFMRLKAESHTVISEEDYSNKKVNPNDGFFN